MFCQHQRDLLYPCLSGMEKDKTLITMVEADMIRLAGGCILSIAVCSILLLVMLLPCCYFGKRNDDGSLCDDGDPMSDYFCLRLVLFLHGKICMKCSCYFTAYNSSLRLTS